ncbi:hypothetical protein Tco_0487488 [Tanacetum coccineum]
MAALLEDKMNIRMSRLEKASSEKNEKTTLLNRQSSREKPTNIQVSSTLPSNTIPNPRNKPRQLRLVSCCIHDGPPIPTAVVKSESEVTKDTRATRSTEDIQPPPFVQEQTKDKDPIEEPSFVANKAKPNLPYPSRLNNKYSKKADILLQSLWKSSQNLHFEISLRMLSFMICHKFAVED